MQKKFAFIQPRSWPLANVKVAEALAKQFSDYDIEVIGIEDLVKTKIALLVINTLQTWLLYGNDILSGNKKFKEAFWRTPYIFNAIKFLVKERLSDQEYSFIFQVQSLFDCSLPNVPNFVYTDHTHLANLNYPDFDVKKLYPKKWTVLEKQVYDNAAKVFVWSSNIRKSLMEQYQQPAEKVICVYAGNNVESNNSTTEYKTYGQGNILFVGLDWERKGGPELIEAFKLVLTKHPNATLTIAGAKPNLQMPNCKLVGKISHAELSVYYESATVFCLPTRVEPFGIVFLEAMQARLPVIGTNVGAIPDFLQNDWNGILVEPGDVQSIANGIVKLLDDPDLCRLYGERNFDLINERYSWMAVSQKLHAHITEYLSQS
ncbi:MAG: glycosyltransferase family 4 protein [Chloroflexi bacterium]|nr:glycosyltransferase family 4 protein [Chloroflexota bacterium]